VTWSSPVSHETRWEREYLVDPDDIPRTKEEDWHGILGPFVKIAIITYAICIFAFLWMTKDLTIASLHTDPWFSAYSVAVLCYLLTRFVVSAFYRPIPDTGYRPTISIIVPAFNEQDGIAATVEACIGVSYPRDKLEVVVINDGSTDETWTRILEAKAEHPEVLAIDLGRNYGKRAAMAEGIRRSTGDLLVFVDSDSYLEPDAAIHIVAPFANPRVGAVVGHADVANDMNTWLTKMQQVRYFAAFKIIKGAESVLSGTVTCASGCCSAYRRSAVSEILDAWEHQTFLGKPATFGDDRSLTNYVLRHRRVVYQSTAVAATIAPETLKRFFTQQLRWKKSWLRESLYVVRYFWRKNPIAAVLTYASIFFPFCAPFVVLHAVFGHVTGGVNDGLWFYLIGTYAAAVLYSLFYAYKRRSGLWHHGMTFILVYMTVLVFQTFWGIATMRDNRWGTRDATVDTTMVDPALLTVLPAYAALVEQAPAVRAKQNEHADITAAVFNATARETVLTS
jgi:hyaluronan synthase